MGNIWATADLSDDFVHELINETGFTRKQINRLYIRFRHLDKAKKGYLVKEDLAIVPAVRFSTNFALTIPCFNEVPLRDTLFPGAAGTSKVALPIEVFI